MSSKRGVLASVVTALFAAFVFSDNDTLHGKFLYDDSGTVARNPMMLNTTSHWDLWTHDYWGEELTSITSHKSWRPITSYTFRWNWLLHDMDTYGYHVVNVIFHALVSAMVVQVMGVLEGCSHGVGAITAGLVYASHPVHAEAVSNISGRAELVGAFFYLLGFLCYSRAVTNNGQQTRWFWVALTILNTLLSMLSKEPGITLLVMCALWDFFMPSAQNIPGFLTVWKRLQGRERKTIRPLCTRLAVLCLATVVIMYWRFEHQGGHEPIFIYDQNPAAMHKDRSTRILTSSWLYCLYLELLLVPHRLCCDWSGDSIPLVQSLSDPRFVWIAALYTSMGLFLASLKPLSSHMSPRARQQLVCFLFFVVPFLLSSNIFLVVGFMKAERVLYLPSLGYCLWVGWAMARLTEGPSRFELNFQQLQNTKKSDPPQPKVAEHSETKTNQPTTPAPQGADDESGREEGGEGGESGKRWRTLALFIFSIVLGALTWKCMQRNRDWRSGYPLWSSAYQANPVSFHIWHNFGLELSWAGADQFAAEIFERAVHRNPSDLNTWFALGIALRRIGRCDKAMAYLKQGLMLAASLAQSREDFYGAPAKDNPKARAHMIAALALCEQDHRVMGRMLNEAITIDPTNSYAIEQANSLIQLMQGR